MRMPVHGGSARARAAAAGAAVVALVLLASLAGRHPAWSTGVGRHRLVSGASGFAVAIALLVALLVATLLAVYPPRFGVDHGRSGHLPERTLPGGGRPGGGGG